MVWSFVIQLVQQGIDTARGKDSIPYVEQQEDDGTVLWINCPSYCDCSGQIQEDRIPDHKGQVQPPQHSQHRKEDNEDQPVHQT